MDNSDLDKIVEKNPHLDRETVEDLSKSMRKLAGDKRPSYRLAPFGTHRVTVSPPALPTRPTKSENHPGF